MGRGNFLSGEGEEGTGKKDGVQIEHMGFGIYEKEKEKKNQKKKPRARSSNKTPNGALMVITLPPKSCEAAKNALCAHFSFFLSQQLVSQANSSPYGMVRYPLPDSQMRDVEEESMPT